MKHKKPRTKKECALYRCRLTCQIGKDACEGKGIPSDVRRKDWIFYQMFSALEDLALALTVDDDEKSE